MSDLRFDPVSNQWVTVAMNRRERPMEFLPIEQTRMQLICPFCAGNEDETPAMRVAYRHDGSQLDEGDDPSDWTVRVIPNKYPSFQSSQDLVGDKTFGGQTIGGQTIGGQTIGGKMLGPVVTPQIDVSPYRSVARCGEQELILASPRHVSSLSELNDEELRISFLAYRDRLAHFESKCCVGHAMLFMNCRSSAGASLSHIHSQLIGSPIVSDFVMGRQSRNQDYYAQHGISLIESIANWERAQGVRMVHETDHFSVFCPFASRFAFQIWIVPKHSQQRFQDFPWEGRDELAYICKRLVQRLESSLDEPGYNLLLHTAPFDRSKKDRSQNDELQSDELQSNPSENDSKGAEIDSETNEGVGNGAASPRVNPEAHHWYFELFPRLTRVAGFEWGTDIWINPVVPKTAARQMRF